jgi:hypothetical protein
MLQKNGQNLKGLALENGCAPIAPQFGGVKVDFKLSKPEFFYGFGGNGHELQRSNASCGSLAPAGTAAPFRA